MNDIEINIFLAPIVRRGTKIFVDLVQVPRIADFRALVFVNRAEHVTEFVWGNSVLLVFFHVVISQP